MFVAASEEEIEEYKKRRCCNISLEDFLHQKREKEVKNAQMHEAFYALKVVKEKINNVKLPPPKLMDRPITRSIIIDGANIMHGGSPYRDNRENAGNQKRIPDVAALLSVIRYFILHNFEVFVVLSRKYCQPDATNFQSAIERLIKHNLCVIVPQTNLDDTVALEFAAAVNGIVITSDQYRDHANFSKRYTRIVAENRLNIEWKDTSEEAKNCRTKEGDYIASRKFRFVDDNGTDLTPFEVHHIVYVIPGNRYYHLSEERLKTSQPEEKKDAHLALLNELIVEGISVCEGRAKEILATPVHDPVEARRQAEEVAAENAENVAPDVQREFIDQLEISDSDEW